MLVLLSGKDPANDTRRVVPHQPCAALRLPPPAQPSQAGHDEGLQVLPGSVALTLIPSSGSLLLISLLIEIYQLLDGFASGVMPLCWLFAPYPENQRVGE